MGLSPRPLDDRDQKIYLVIKKGIEGQTKLGVKPLGVCTGWIVEVTGVGLKCIYYRLQRLKRAGLVGCWKANGRTHWFLV
jgi:hypothetical protein